MGHLLALSGINTKPKQIMKTKIFIPLAGLTLFCACSGKHAGESADSIKTVSPNTRAVTSKSDSTQQNQKLVKTADIRFKVKDVRQTSEQVAALTASCNGTVIHHFINSVASDSANIRKSDDSLLKVTVLNTTAEMTVKIPPAKMEDFVNQVARMGIRVNNLKMEISDKSLAYLATRLKLKNQKELVNNQKTGRGNLKDPDNLLAFKNNMVDQQLSNLRTDDSVKNSTITLSFYESSIVHRELIANPDLSAYNLPVTTQLGMSLKNGWEKFVEVIVALANLWVLLPIAVGVWLVLRYNKRKKLRLS